MNVRATHARESLKAIIQGGRRFADASLNYLADKSLDAVRQAKRNRARTRKAGIAVNLSNYPVTSDDLVRKSPHLLPGVMGHRVIAKHMAGKYDLPGYL